MPAKPIVEMYDQFHPKHTTFGIAETLPSILGYDHPSLRRFKHDKEAPDTEDILALFSSNERKQSTSRSTYLADKRYILYELEKEEEAFLRGSSTNVAIRFVSPDWSLRIPDMTYDPRLAHHPNTTLGPPVSGEV